MSRHRSQRNYGCRIHDQYTYRGMRTVVLENELVRISIFADKGTEIFEYLYKPQDLDFMWLTANGVQNPNDYLPTSPDPISTFIDYYPGGWQEVFPNGGPTSIALGARFGQHGEVAHMPWDWEIAEDTPERIAVRFSLRTKKYPVRLTKTLSLEGGSSCLRIEERLENESDVPVPYMWGHHIALGKPFLAPGCRIGVPENVKIVADSDPTTDSPPGRVVRGTVSDWPYGTAANGDKVDFSVLPEFGTLSEMVYLTGFDERAWYTVENHALGIGFRVNWDVAEMPYLWYWQEYGATKAYPWFGRHYNIGLEPFAGYPTSGLADAIRNGSAGMLQARETKSFWLTAEPYAVEG